MLETIGWPELLVIGIVFVVLFGGKKIPEIGKGIGEGIKNFKAALKSESEKEEEKVVEKV
jgi:sec-independent protein translocase protein TatA